MNIEYIKDILNKSEILELVVDPDETPYKSKYESMELLKSLKEEIIKSNQESSLSQDTLDYLVVIDSKLGELYIATEEITVGLTLCNESLKQLETIQNKFPLETISALQAVSIILINKNEFEIGKLNLEKSEKLINQTIDQQQQSTSTTNNFNQIKLDSLQLQNYFYFAQLYGLLKDSKKSSKYCELVLRKQLKNGNKFDKYEWCKNNLMLAEYYLSERNFDYTRQCIQVCNYICNEIDSPADKEETQANIYLMLGKYFLEFLHFFRMVEDLNHSHKIQKDEDIDFMNTSGANNEQMRKRIEMEKQLEDKRFNENQLKKDELLDTISFNKRSLNNDKPLFTELGADKLKEISEIKFTSSIDLLVVKDQSTARDIFLKSQHFLNKSKKYYKLDGFVSQHIKILFDQINLYDNLNAFENNAGRKIAINNKKIELVQPLLKELNPTYFISTIRSIYFKIAEIHTDNSRIYQMVCSNLREIQIYNDTLFKAMEYYNLFINSYNSGVIAGAQSFTDQEKMVSIIEDFDVYLNANLELAVCHKNVKGINKVLSEHLSKSLEIFKSTLKLLESVPSDVSSNHQQETSLCRQMVTLLPQKIAFTQNKIPTKWYDKNNTDLN